MGESLEDGIRPHRSCQRDLDPGPHGPGRRRSAARAPPAWRDTAAKASAPNVACASLSVRSPAARTSRACERGAARSNRVKSSSADSNSNAKESEGEPAEIPCRRYRLQDVAAFDGALKLAVQRSLRRHGRRAPSSQSFPMRPVRARRLRAGLRARAVRVTRAVRLARSRRRRRRVVPRG